MTLNTRAKPGHPGKRSLRGLAASSGLLSLFAIGGVLLAAGTAPASGGQDCQMPTTTSAPSTSTSSSSSTTSATTTSAPAPPPPTIPEPTGHPLNDNTVENCADATRQARSQFQVAYSGASGTPVNFAYAYAHDCATGCQAIAVSFQVVLQDKNAKSQAPQNVALAVNYRCHACGVFAYADQYVVDVPPGTRLPSATRHQLAAIRRQAESDVHAQLTFSELDGRLHALASKLALDVNTGLQNARVPETPKGSSEHHKQAGQA